MLVKTIYASFQGEQNIWGIGAPVIFLRTAGCHIRCYLSTYNKLCDTPSALSLSSGSDMSFEEILEEFQKYDIKNVCLTGGDPLFSMSKTKTDIDSFFEFFIDRGYRFSVETSGIDYYLEIENERLRPHISVVYDWKLSSSGIKNSDKRNVLNIPSVLNSLTDKDYIKFVVADFRDLADYYEAIEYIRDNNKKVNICIGLYEGSERNIEYTDIIDLIKGNNILLNFQAHKYLYSREDIDI